MRVVARGEKEIADNPERYAGLAPVRPLQALGYLRTYIKDAKHASEMVLPPRNIARRNKKYMLAFGEDCEELFQYLGFTSVEEVQEKGEVSRSFMQISLEIICHKLHS
jgi:ubiquitin carboxyl-terminal hydrolase 25/28